MKIIGTQFHPEADPQGMLPLFRPRRQRDLVIKNHGEKKYFEMVDMLDDPEKIVIDSEDYHSYFFKNCFCQGAGNSRLCLRSLHKRSSLLPSIILEITDAATLPG
jgi:hypothetical protein